MKLEITFGWLRYVAFFYLGSLALSVHKIIISSIIDFWNWVGHFTVSIMRLPCLLCDCILQYMEVICIKCQSHILCKILMLLVITLTKV
jgi:hypothetical protein